jgi:hypothetical protein
VKDENPKEGKETKAVEFWPVKGLCQIFLRGLVGCGARHGRLEL